MEKQQEKRNVGEKKGGLPSRNSGQTGPEPKEHRIDINEISPRVKNWIGSLKKIEERTQSQTQWPRTPKIPQMLRGTQDFKKFYEPRVISIGPYHHGKPHLDPVEMIKPLCARNFLDDIKQDIEALYTKIESNTEAVKKCYDWSSTNKYDDDKLAWIMLLDGFFLLQFIHGKGMRNFLRNHQINFVVQDLFLLENQLPFRVLKLIFEEANFNKGSSMEELIKKFVTDTPSHLLDLLRSALLGRIKRLGGSQPEQEQQPEKKEKSSSSQRGDGRGIWLYSFQRIKELKASRIHLKPSRTSMLTGVSFNSYFFYGYLKLPPIIIGDFTKHRFLNIVAYEMCLDALDDYGVTSYICLLYHLIDHADDVKELRSKHILYNLLGKIGNDLVDPEAYKDVKDCIQEHYNKRMNTWIAQAFHDHFNTPRTIIAFIAAVLILFLTGV
ncbi:hypothetical protein PVL29_018535 [Vitis rotundifolia]|uniref:Uncharacterized protein n=1 Tax=Vitis rotundifolia TaxID=103349 RepID=A0AA39DGB7_VITRO|nr:hypothetical protein PVL29_018535 [Vitis rotundifolia]